MKIFTVSAMLLSVLLFPSMLLSADLDSLASEGYKVVEETRVAGNYEYKGCLTTGPLRLANSKVFVCTTFGYDNQQYMPNAIILKNKDGDYKILINGKAFSGYFINEQ